MAKAKPYHVLDGYNFVAYPNRDSVPFRDFYGIPEAHTVIRGSLRYDGNPAFVQALANLGWLEQDQKDWLRDGMTWAEIQQHALGASAKDEKSLILRIREVAKFTSEAESERIISGMRWMGILSSEKALITGGNLLDTLCTQLAKIMSFKPGERDLVMLQHKFVVEWANGQTETLTSIFELLGDPKRYSAMSHAVGTTCGIATQLMMDGHPALSKPGVLAPYEGEMCNPIRALVEKEGIKMIEATVKG
ncbi:MAG: hypothetical protein M1836_002037 [Candelina mexicana]|nr:MAG: hypothetical protein M1836_002037 [Candelina mexicana]